MRKTHKVKIAVVLGIFFLCISWDIVQLAHRNALLKMANQKRWVYKTVAYQEWMDSSMAKIAKKEALSATNEKKFRKAHSLSSISKIEDTILIRLGRESDSLVRKADTVMQGTLFFRYLF